MTFYNDANDKIEEFSAVKKPATELTIAAGVITATQDIHTVDTEADAAADDLNTINGIANGQTIEITLENNARIVTLKHGAGNLLLPDTNDIVMVPNGIIILTGDGTNVKAVAAGGGGGAVDSVFTRTGAVVAAASDYDASQVDNDSTVTGAFVDDALDTLQVDNDASIHDNVAGEINAIASKATPVGADLILIEDSAAANAKKKILISALPGGTDADAIHDNVAAEISAITEKVSPVGADLILIEDSADTNNKKRVQITNLPGGSDPNAIHDNVASEISAITEKVTPVAADLFIIEDSADTNNKKRVQLGNMSVAALGEYVNIWIPASAMTPTVTDGAEPTNENYSSNDINFGGFRFDAATEQKVQFTIAMPDKWDLGTFKTKFYWDAVATASGTAVWGIKARSISNDDAIDAALGAEITVTDTLIAVGDLHVSPATAAVTSGGTPVLEDMTLFEVVLKTSGTIAVDCILAGIAIQYKELDSTPVIW